MAVLKYFSQSNLPWLWRVLSHWCMKVKCVHCLKVNWQQLSSLGERGYTYIQQKNSSPLYGCSLLQKPLSQEYYVSTEICSTERYIKINYQQYYIIKICFSMYHSELRLLRQSWKLTNQPYLYQNNNKNMGRLEHLDNIKMCYCVILVQHVFTPNTLKYNLGSQKLNTKCKQGFLVRLPWRMMSP